MAIKSATEDFNRADSTNLGAGWTEDQVVWAIQSNALGRDDTPAGVTAGLCTRVLGTRYGPDVQIACTLGPNFDVAAIDGFLLDLRKAREDDLLGISTMRYGFGYLVSPDGPQPGDSWIIKDDGGPSTAYLASRDDLPPPAAGDALVFLARGDTLEGWRNGVLILSVADLGTRKRYEGDFGVAVRNAAGVMADQLFDSFDVAELTDTVVARPIATTIAGTWVGTVADLWLNVDEDVPNDTTDVSQSAALTGAATDTWEALLEADGGGPVPLGRPRYVLFVRWRKNTAAGAPITGTLELRQGGTLIASVADDNTRLDDGSGWVERSYLLSAAEAAAITDGADLRLRFIAAATGAGAARRLTVTTARLHAVAAATADDEDQDVYVGRARRRQVVASDDAVALGRERIAA